MKRTILTALAGSAILVFGASAFGQKASSARNIIFAVLNDGKTLEPIAYINKNKLGEPVNGSDDSNIIKAFNKTYYKAGTTYRLIWGGSNAGNVKVKSSDANAECSKNTAVATTTSSKVTLKGLVMGLATNQVNKATNASYRRKPTGDEKAEMDALAKAEFKKEKLTADTLHYQNLTAIDVDTDGKAEFVASYWIDIDKTTRGLLFFIASKASNGKYSIGYKEYRSIDKSNLMEGADITAVDQGTYHELLLDAFDYDNDGTAEIFTTEPGLEAQGFHAYKRNGTKWTRVYEFNNYHCGF
jgi:hypothetical protein